MDKELSDKIEKKISPLVEAVLKYISKAVPEAHETASDNWNSYKPELQKCRTPEEAARLFLSYFERTMKALSKNIEGKKFIRIRNVAVKKMRIGLYTLKVNRNTVRDYVNQIYKIQGKPVEEPDKRKKSEKIRVEKADDKKVESTLGNPISLEELKKRISGKPRSVSGRRITKNMALAGLFSIMILYMFIRALF